MARCYEYKFRSAVGRKERLILGWGNTRRSALRCARSRLRDLGLDPDDYVVVGEPRHVPPTEQREIVEP